MNTIHSGSLRYLSHVQCNLPPYHLKVNPQQRHSIRVVLWTVVTWTPSCAVASNPMVTLPLVNIVTAVCISERAPSSRNINSTAVLWGRFSAFNPAPFSLCIMKGGMFVVGTLLTICSKTIIPVTLDCFFIWLNTLFLGLKLLHLFFQSDVFIF